MPTRGDRGAVAVEAALVFPILALLAFGMIETTLLLRDHVSATSLARAGARVASAEPRFGTVAGHDGGPSFAQDAADSIERAGATLPRGLLDYVWIYQATAAGDPVGACPGTKCVQYAWNNLPAPNGRFVYQGGTWDPASINACLGDPSAQSVGVRIQATHPWVVGFPFTGAAPKVTARTVMKFEPLLADHTYAGVAPGCK
jgi:hypothetical protein